MAVRPRESSGTIGHPHDRDPLAGHVRQGIRGDQLDLIERRTRRGAVRAKREQDVGYLVHRQKQRFSAGQGADKTDYNGE